MIRCLAGELDHKEPLNHYINPTKEDIWDEDILEKDIQLYNLVERMSGNIKLQSIHSSYLFIQDWNTRQQQLQRPVGPVMEEVKQEQGPAEIGAGQSIIRPAVPYKPPQGKAPPGKSIIDLKNLMQKKKKPTDAV